MVNLHPYTDRDTVRARCGNFDATDVSDANVDSFIEGNADYVELETQRIEIGWHDTEKLTNNYIKNLVTDFSAADVLENYVSRWAGESAKEEAKKIRDWATVKLEALKRNLTGPEQDQILFAETASYETYDAMLHDGEPNPTVYRSTTFV